MECLESSYERRNRLRSQPSTLVGQKTCLQQAIRTITDLTKASKVSPLLYVFLAALLWSTGGLFIKCTKLTGLEISFYRSLFAGITVAIFTRHEGFGINRVTAVGSGLYAVLLILLVLATKEPTAAKAIFLQDRAPVPA